MTQPRPRRGETPARPQLRVVAPPSAAESERLLVRRLVVAGVIVAAVCIFGVVSAHVLLTQNQFHLDELQRQSGERQAQYDRLRLQVAELESPVRIVAAASERLGMVTPASITYLAPAVEEPFVEGVAVGSTAAAGRRAGAADREPTSTSWSTVKPHLADN